MREPNILLDAIIDEAACLPAAWPRASTGSAPGTAWACCSITRRFAGGSGTALSRGAALRS
jgi:hypothetical protein